MQVFSCYQHIASSLSKPLLWPCHLILLDVIECLQPPWCVSTSPCCIIAKQCLYVTEKNRCHVTKFEVCGLVLVVKIQHNMLCSNLKGYTYEIGFLWPGKSTKMHSYVTPAQFPRGSCVLIDGWDHAASSYVTESDFASYM